LRGGPILMCGPDAMMVAMRALLAEMGIPDDEILQEEFVSPPTPGPGEPEPADEVPVNGAAPNVRFERSGKSTEVAGELTLLEAAEDCGVAIPFECRSGICGQCKTRVLSGRVVMEVEDALTRADRASGIVLACQARAAQDLVVDA
ncbi:MAG TPA: 2Fe-2S iron-sulfur cluster-binding protein, partial [Kofleriaceae bacterium]|nr:2Fe-2S iron-sulfur cluster-binding protein [Kofleriaceae bacterium]